MSKKDLQTAIRGVVSAITSLRTENEENARNYSSILVRLSILVAQGAPMITESGADWRDWAVAQCHGFGPEGGDLSPSTAYRLRNAGAVASVIGPENVGTASYLSLVPLYRFLASAKTDEETTQAQTLIQTLWAQAQKGAGKKDPTAENVLSLVEKKNGNGGTRGSAGKGAEGRKETQTKKNARSRNTPTQTTETKDPETDPGARDACRKGLNRILSKFDADSVPTVLAAMAAAVKLAETHGVGVTAAIIAETAKENRK